MPKKKSSKTPKEVQENAVVKEEKSSSAKKKCRSEPKEVLLNDVVKEEKPPSGKGKCHSEIDEIFAGKKRKKSDDQKEEKIKVDASDRPMKVKNRKKNESECRDGFADPPSRPRKKTGDGLIIYTEDELGVNNAEAGGTPLCPFDCSCCF